MQENHSLLSSFFQRRKHKLYRALSSPPPVPTQCVNPRQHLLCLFDTISNKQNQISQLNYYIKHEFSCDISNYTTFLTHLIRKIIVVRSGSIASFIIYRLCRKYPGLFWKIFYHLSSELQDYQWTLQTISFYTELFLYGFPFTFEDFNKKIFKHYQDEVLELIPRYSQELGSNLNFPAKYQKMFKNQLLQWLQEEKNKIIVKYEELSKISVSLQDLMVQGVENELQLINYEMELELYETALHRFNEASTYMMQEFSPSLFKLKPIFLLKKQCETFKTSFSLSPYQQSLYYSKNQLTEIRPLKKHEMLKLSQSEAFINKIKLCDNVLECLNLSGYFLEQMNLQRNREYLVETIINQCYGYNNLPYILKIVFQIGRIESSVSQYCQSKAKKICGIDDVYAGGSRMNPKYQKLICEMTKFNLIEDNVVLQYCQKIIKNENNQTIKEIQAILQQLGTITYYRSLQTHIRINALFERIEGIIKNKLNQFSTEHLYQLKGVLHYLRNHTNSISQTESKELAQIEIKENFDFILKKMEKKIKEKQIQEVLSYLVFGVDSQLYLTSYYYASLISELNCRELEQKIHRITFDTIGKYLEEGNCQKAVIWSRFLGELYNYQCISRRQYLKDLLENLKLNSEQSRLPGSIKCVCSALQTSKEYLKSNNVKRQNEVLLFLLEVKIFYVRITNELEYCLNCELLDIFDFFNSDLKTVLNKQQEIHEFLQLFQKDQNKWNGSIAKYLTQLTEGITFQQLTQKENGSQTKKKYKQKQSPNIDHKKMTEKDSKFQKYKPKEVSEFKLVPQTDLISKQSVNTLQSVPAEVKKMKFMGRSRKDNKIKKVICTLTADSQDR